MISFHQSEASLRRLSGCGHVPMMLRTDNRQTAPLWRGQVISIALYLVKEAHNKTPCHPADAPHGGCDGFSNHCHHCVIWYHQWPLIYGQYWRNCHQNILSMTSPPSPVYWEFVRRKWEWGDDIFRASGDLCWEIELVRTYNLHSSRLGPTTAIILGNDKGKSWLRNSFFENKFL